MDLSRINTNQICGLGSEEMDFMQYLLASTDDIIYDQWTGLPATSNNELYELSDEQMQEISVMENNAKSENTERQTKNYVNMLKTFLSKNSLPNNIEDMPLRYLESYLRLFFTKIRKRKDEHYAEGSLVCMRAAFHRYLLDVRRIEIIDNPDFRELDKTFKASINESLKTREVLVSEAGTGYPAIDEEDKENLSRYFNRRTPQRLQDEVFFTIVYHFGFRGREWMRSLTKSSLKFSVNGDETFIDLLKATKEKNVKAGKAESFRQIIITETENKDLCPVEAIKLYYSKLPNDSTTLFPKPKINWTKGTWYCQKEPLGKNTLNDMMKQISIRAELKTQYTNHCIRATTVTTMKDQGFSDKEVMAVTGQKSFSTIDRYNKRNSKLTFNEKKVISKALSGGLTNGDSNQQSSESKSICMQQSCTMGTSDCVSTSTYCSSQTRILGPPHKRMKIVSNGDTNVVTITFE